jgi:uncharacterized glyoxalase superfamily protein PhnB
MKTMSTIPFYSQTFSVRVTARVSDEAERLLDQAIRNVQVVLGDSHVVSAVSEPTDYRTSDSPNGTTCRARITFRTTHTLLANNALRKDLREAGADLPEDPGQLLTGGTVTNGKDSDI